MIRLTIITAYSSLMPTTSDLQQLEVNFTLFWYLDASLLKITLCRRHAVCEQLVLIWETSNASYKVRVQIPQPVRWHDCNMKPTTSVEYPKMLVVQHSQLREDFSGGEFQVILYPTNC